MSRSRLLLPLAAFAALIPELATAADIAVFDQNTSQPLIVLTGEIKAGDDEKFRSIASKYSNAIVVLDSNGGAIFPAMDIGRAIKLREYTTAVYKDSVCASACALIWIAGQRRVIFDGGQVGFHASYTDENGRLLETGVGNALVGHYLTQLGFGEQTVIFATMAAPDKILWLNSESSPRSGIEYQQIPVKDDQTKPTENGATLSQSVDQPPPPITFSSTMPQTATGSHRGVSSGAPMMADAKQTIRNVDSFARGLKANGYQADVDYSDPKSPSIYTGVGGHKIVISFSGCDDHNCNYIELMAFWSGIEYGKAMIASQKWSTEERFSSLLYFPKNSSIAAYHYIIAGSDGITLTNLIQNLTYFSNDFGSIGDLLAETK